MAAAPWRGQPDGRPGPTHVGSWQDAELNAAAWMRYWGYTDATASPGGADRGIDIRANGALGQVKYRPSQVGRGEIQGLLGAAIDHPNAQLFFFAGSSFSRPAIEEADRRGVALFTFVLDGTMTAVNAAARRITERPREAKRTKPKIDPKEKIRRAEERKRQREKDKEQAERLLAFIGRLLTSTVRNWRVVLAVLLFLFATVGITDKRTYTGDAGDFAAAVIGVCVLVGLGVLLIRWHVRRRRSPSR